MWEDLQKVESLTKAQKHGSNFMNLCSYEELRGQFVDVLPEMGALVTGLGCTAFNAVCGAGLVPKPLLAAMVPK